MNSRRRIAVVAGGVFAATCALATYLSIPAFAASGGKLTGTPCTTSARVCIDLDDQTGWIAEGGKVVRGPINVSTGGPGKQTPLGTFHVMWKDKDHKSNEFRLPNGQKSPMPWAVFFAPGGIAIHQGTLERASSGCVRLAKGTAEGWFNLLKVGDEVQVVFSEDEDFDGASSDGNQFGGDTVNAYDKEDSDDSDDGNGSDDGDDGDH